MTNIKKTRDIMTIKYFKSLLKKWYFWIILIINILIGLSSKDNNFIYSGTELFVGYCIGIIVTTFIITSFFDWVGN